MSPIVFFFLITYAISVSSFEAPKISRRIVNGKRLTASEAPFQVTLVKRRSIWGSYRYEPFCSGSLITNQHVLTAAHCVEKNNPNFRLFLGMDNIFDPERVMASPLSIHLHPQYNKDDKEDIAIIKLLEPINLDSGKIKLVTLSKVEPALNAKSRVAGFGFTKFGRLLSRMLLSTVLSVVDHEICKDRFLHYYSDKIMLCLTDVDADSGTCGGDSGAPSIDTQTGQQIGVVSYGPDKVCGVKGVPEAHMSIHYYHDWIQSVIRDTS